MKVKIDNMYILQLATAYAMSAMREYSGDEKEYWKSVVFELQQKMLELKIRMEVLNNDN